MEGLIAHQNQNQGHKPLICPYCDKKGHYPDKCRTVTDPDRRKAILTEKRRCYLCTKENHIVPKCPAKRNCVKCNKKHHTSLCKGQRDDNENGNGGVGTVG